MLRRLILLIGLALVCVPGYAAKIRYATYNSVIASGTCESPTVALGCTLIYVASIAAPGDTLKLNGTNPLTDGHFASTNAMLVPPVGLSGTALEPITVEAVNHGKVWIDGDGVRLPCNLNGNDYWILGSSTGGFYCSDSSGEVVRLHHGADHNIVRWVCAWNAHDGTGTENSSVWMVSETSRNNLIEDWCGFGVGRKIIIPFQTDGPNEIRRGWAQWMDYHSLYGPRQAASWWYTSRYTTWENNLFTWYEDPLMVPNADMAIALGDGCNECEFTPLGRGVFAKVYGNWVYMPSGRSYTPGNFWVMTVVDEVDLNNNIVVVPSDQPAIIPTNISNCKTKNSLGADCSTYNLHVSNHTNIGGAPVSPSGQWAQSNVRSASTMAGVYGTGNIFLNDGVSRGATICDPYEGGSLQVGKGLFASDGTWATDQFIYDAMTIAGGVGEVLYGRITPVHVTAQLTSMAGVSSVPDACRRGSEEEAPGEEDDTEDPIVPGVMDIYSPTELTVVQRPDTFVLEWGQDSIFVNNGVVVVRGSCNGGAWQLLGEPVYNIGQSGGHEHYTIDPAVYKIGACDSYQIEVRASRLGVEWGALSRPFKVRGRWSK